MTGMELIMHIIENNLINEPVFKDDKFIGFLHEEEVAKRFDVGTATIRVLVNMDKLEGIRVNGKLYISISSIKKYEKKEKSCVEESQQ